MGANLPSADPPGAVPLGADPASAHPPGAVLQVRPPGCSTSTSPCGVPEATGSDCCCCWKTSGTVSEAAAAATSSPFPCCLVRHFPSSRTSALGSCATFGPVPRILSSGRWPAERPAFACACACARLRVWVPPSGGTESAIGCRWGGSSFPGSGILVHSPQKPAARGECRCTVVASHLVARHRPSSSALDGWKASGSRSCWACQRPRPCWADRGNAGNLWPTCSAGKQRLDSVRHRSHNTDWKTKRQAESVWPLLEVLMWQRSLEKKRVLTKTFNLTAT